MLILIKKELQLMLKEYTKLTVFKARHYKGLFFSFPLFLHTSVKIYLGGNNRTHCLHGDSEISRYFHILYF